jgi:hypothetical protein
MPNSCAAPARQEAGIGYLVNWHMPIDDVSHWKYMFLFKWDGPIDKNMVARTGSLLKWPPITNRSSINPTATIKTELR